MASWIAAATSYSTSNVPMIPFYIYYSMFGFQRIGDLAWAAGDMRARGFLVGGTSGRTTLNGEGLQHEDGHSHILSATIPNCVSYDPTFSYELAVIIQDGLQRMIGDQEDVYYYLTTLNENYEHPAMPEGAEEGIIKGMYLLKAAEPKKAQGQARSPDGLRRDPARGHRRGRAAGAGFRRRRRHLERHELHRARARGARTSSAGPCCIPRSRSACPRSSSASPSAAAAPVIASTDYMRLYAEQIRAHVPGPYKVLGTDGFGRSDYRKSLRTFFEVDRHYVAVAALKQLADAQLLPSKTVAEAIAKYGIDPAKPNPARV